MFYILHWFMQDTHMRPLTVDGYTCSNTLKSHTWPYLLLAPIRRCWSSQVSPLALHGDRCTPIDALMANSHAVGMHHRWWEYIHMMRIHICVLYIYMFVKIYLFKQWKYLVHTSSQTQALTLWTHLAGVSDLLEHQITFRHYCNAYVGAWLVHDDTYLDSPGLPLSAKDTPWFICCLKWPKHDICNFAVF